MKKLDDLNDLTDNVKKELFFDNKIIKILKYPAIMNAVIFGMISMDNLRNYMKQHGGKKTIKDTIISLMGSYFLTDFVSGLYHIFITDNILSSNSHKLVGDTLELNFTSGHTSLHHLMPSNWKNVTDMTFFITTSALSTPLFFVFYKYPKSRLFLSTLIPQILLAVIPHKYAHERNHNRHVPIFYKLMQDLHIFLEPQHHKTHHENLYKNFGMYSGKTDFLTNMIIKLLETIKKDIHYGDVVNFFPENKEVKVKLTGDVNETLIIKKVGHSFYKV